MSKFYLSSLITLFHVVIIYSQTTVVSSIGKNVNSSGKIEYVVGHTFFNTVSATGNGSLGNIFEALHEFSVLGTDDTKVNYKLATYPNPTSDYLNIKVDVLLDNTKDLSFGIFEASGKEVKSGKLEKGKSRVNLNLLPKAIYIFSLKKNGKPIFSTRILKK